ncbi:MAG: asparagine synthase (glutamine-hydrolyzing), partial [Flavobacteriaceae bacterium]
SKGFNFETSSDTEVLLKSYELWNEKCVDKLEGMFAFVIWDRNRNLCFAARDRFGEKPLYYAVSHDGMFMFASEAHVITNSLGYEKNINFKGLGQFLSLGYCLGQNTLIDSVRKLEPASTLTYRPGETPSISRYWSLKPFFETKNSNSFRENSTEIANRIDEAIQREIIADVPLGAFLSGGLDSSAIVASLVKHCGVKNLKCFSMAFSESGFDETEFVTGLSHFLDIDPHIGLAMHSRDAVDKAFASAARVPIADNSYLPMIELSGHAKKHVTVSLSGDGADELFAGYDTYRAGLLHRFFRYTPKGILKALQYTANNLVPTTRNKVSFDYKLRQFLGAVDMSSSRAHHWWRLIFSQNQLGQLCSEDVRQRILSENGFDIFDKYWDDLDGVSNLDRAQYVDINTWLPDNILEKVDRSSMSNSLEVRAPFLNHKFAEWAVTIPSHQNIRYGRLKATLKNSQRNRLPDSTIYRKKRGFNAPISHLLVNDNFNDIFFDRLKSKKLEEFVCKKSIDTLVHEHRNMRFDHSFRLYTLACLGMWMETYN